ncbi:MAG: aspartate aminotransferase family protein [Geminicoccaceae bacterium]
MAGHVFPRSFKGDLPVAVRGDGPYLIDSKGKRYLDACGGAAVSCLGHSHPAVIDAIKRQVDSLAFAHTAFFSNEPMEALADYLIARAPGELDRVYFVSGGSEAVESALKLARQYWIEVGEPERAKFIARRQSYHGNTLGALAVGGNEWRRAPFRPMLAQVSHVAPCYPYRDQKPGQSDAAYVAQLAEELDHTIRALGPQTVCAFVLEPVVGATSGALPALPGYLKAMRDVCDRHGVLLIFDEVMCGMGRTGFRFACEEDGVAPDILAIAKGLGAGYQPIGAMLASKHIVDALIAGSGFFQHGHTYLGHATACAAALAVQQTIDGEDLLSRVRSLGKHLAAGLVARFERHPHVGNIRGRGLFRGIELVADRATKAPFDPKLRLHAHIKARAFAEGLMVYPMGGTIDGQRGDHILLAPPFILDEAQIDEIVERLALAIDTALAHLPQAA